MSKNYKVYLVGGAVRDKILDLNVSDRDWVVVGATPDDLLNLNYQQVGKDFPVFLHPKTKEEYALARTEKKTSKGYTGFICDFNPNISLEEDLARRDLTINAMAEDDNGNIIDPFNGLNDIKNKQLRHVSNAFIEDPLRVFRVCRFAARYHKLGFNIANETLNLMKSMVNANELNTLSVERIWHETVKALSTEDPQVYFQILYEINALKIFFPEINDLFGVPNPEQHHPEIDTGIHSLLSLKQATILSKNLPIERACRVRFAALCHDLGKALTLKDKWPKHYGHDALGVIPAKNLLNRLKAPTSYINFITKVCRYHMQIHRIYESRSSTILRLFDALGVWRNPDILFDLCLVSEADAKGRPGYENINYPNFTYLHEMFKICLQVDIKKIIEKGYQGEKIKEQIQHQRITLMNELKIRLNQR